MQAGNIPESVRMAGQRAPWVGIEGPGAFLACASSLRRRQFCTPIALTLSIEDVACVQDDLVRVAHKIHALKLTRPAPASWGDDAVQRMLCNLVSSCTNLQHFDISNTQGEVKDVVVQQLASSCRDLVGLDASYCDGEITDVSMVQVARRCRQLEYLSVGANNRMITDGSILVLARHARHLRHLNVSATGGAITSTSIEQILCRCNHLCTLDISHTNIAAGIVLWMLNALQAPSLTLHFLVDAKPARAEWRYPSVIIVTGCEATGWGDDNFALATVIGKDARSDGMRVVTALQALAFNAVSALLVGVAHKIHALKLTRPAPASWGDDAVQRMLCNVVSRCTNLRHFDISNTQGEVKDVVVQQLASSCRDLVGLDASYCDGEITNQSIMHVARRCRQLEYLSVGANNRKITDDSILVLARHARHLRHLNVSATGGAVTSTSIEQILCRCNHLRTLDISHTNIAAGIVLWMLNALQAPSLTLHFLVDAKPARAEWRYPSVSIVTGCEATGKGDFTLAARIGKDTRSVGMCVVTALQALAFNAVSALLVGVAHNIHALKLTRPAPASWGDDDVQRMLCKLVSKCTNLRHFDISNTQGEVKNAVVHQLASSCPDLVGLDVSYCDGEITDVSIMQVARRCRQLEYLSVGANNRMITDDSIYVLARHSRHLRHLNVSATGGAVTSTSIEQILRRCARIELVDTSHTSLVMRTV